MSRLTQRLRYIATTGARRRIRDRVVGLGAADRFVVREDLARRYLRGDGIEIGPATWPLRLPPGARVRYVDRLSKADYIAEFGASLVASGRDPDAIPETDVIDDAATLATFADASVDFVVANHVLEHIEDPIAALENLARVLRPGGVLFITLPDARHSFDARRERTTVEHLLRDHDEGPAVSRQGHYEEWAHVIEGATGARVAERAAEFAAEDARHHFHVWELDDFLALLRAIDLPCDLEAAIASDAEFAVVLRART